MVILNVNRVSVIMVSVMAPLKRQLSHFVLELSFFDVRGRVTRLGEILPFGLLFKGLGYFLSENIICCRYFKS